MLSSFELPNDAKVMSEVVRLIRGFSFVSGRLEASKGLVDSGMVTVHTGFNFQRFHQIHTFVETEHSETDEIPYYQRERAKRLRRTEGLLAIAVRHQFPGFVQFSEAGYEGQPMESEALLDVIEHYLQIGYRGILHFDNGSVDRHEYWTRHAAVTMFVGAEGKFPPNAPYSVDFDLSHQQGDEFVKPALQYCKEHLKELVLKP